MPRDSYISDNLYDMRERFKRTFPVPDSSAAPETQETPPPPSPPDLRTAAMPRLPSLPGNYDGSEAGRDRRDLEGRLIRDLNFAEAELEAVNRRSDAIKNFHAAAERLLTEISRLDNSTPDEYGKALTRLRIEYFQASGRFEAAIRSHSASTPENTPVQNGKQSNWQLVLGMISAAVIVALALFAVF